MKQQVLNKRTPGFPIHYAKSILIILGLCVIPQGFCQTAALEESTATPKEFRFTIKHFTIEGSSPLSQAFMDDFFSPLQDRTYSLKELQDISKAFEQKIHELGYPFYRVVIPPQTLAQGTVKLQIISFTLGEIEVAGNEYFTRENIIASLPILNKIESPNTQELSEALQVANKHPSKQLNVIFKPSKIQDKLDTRISVAERHPIQASVIGNNYGTPSSGDYRIIGELQYSNLWGRDHVINASYSTSPDHVDSVRQFGGSYSLPIYSLKGWLSAYYLESTVNIGTVATSLTVTGAGKMSGIHYQQYLPNLGRYGHSLNLGFDNRFFINDIQFQNTEIGSNVRSTPVSALYKGDYPWQNINLTYYAQWLGNVGAGGQNSQANYEANRLNAAQDWNLVRFGSNLLVNVKSWLIQTTLIGQQSQYSLIAGEQLGIGGSFDVRGYGQRETGADSGQIVKFEVAAPPWQQINLFAFFDYGHGRLHSTTPTQVKDWSLAGTGFGARFQWRKYLLGNLTFANALKTAHAGTTQAGDSRIYFNVVYKLF